MSLETRRLAELPAGRVFVTSTGERGKVLYVGPGSVMVELMRRERVTIGRRSFTAKRTQTVHWTRDLQVHIVRRDAVAQAVSR